MFVSALNNGTIRFKQYFCSRTLAGFIYLLTCIGIVGCIMKTLMSFEALHALDTDITVGWLYVAVIIFDLIGHLEK